MDLIKCSIKYLPQDLQMAYMIHFKKNYPIRRLLIPVTASFLILISIFLIVITKSGETTYESNWFIAACFFIVYALAFLAYYIWKMKTMGNRMFKKIHEFKKEFYYEFSEERIVAKSDDFISSDVKWSYYQEAIIDNDIILLFPNKLKFNFYHKRYFTAEEFEQLKKWAVKNVSKTRYN